MYGERFFAGQAFAGQFRIRIRFVCKQRCKRTGKTEYSDVSEQERPSIVKRIIQDKETYHRKLMREIRIKNEKETRQFGEQLARTIVPGDVIALIGDLGTGKTTLTKYIARELGIMEAITSPTFTIINEYDSGRLPLYHFDVYRLDSPDEMINLGYEEYFFGEGVCIVEWADKIEELMPENTKTIKISYAGQDPQQSAGPDYSKGAPSDAQEERIYRCDF